MSARVYNDTKFTLTCTQIRKIIRPKCFVLVTDAEAGRVHQNGQFRVVYDEPPVPEAVEVPEAPVRKRSVRGSKVAEESAPPKSEKRTSGAVWYTDSPDEG